MGRRRAEIMGSERKGRRRRRGERAVMENTGATRMEERYKKQRKEIHT